MSWIVEALLRDRERIRAISDISDDSFLDLMMIEGAIDSLASKGLFTDKEVLVINEVGDGSSLADIGRRLGLNGSTVARKLKHVCELVSYKLGGEFTDEGYLTRLMDNHDLTAEQVAVLQSFMVSKYKRTIPRGSKGENK